MERHHTHTHTHTCTFLLKVDTQYTHTHAHTTTTHRPESARLRSGSPFCTPGANNSHVVRVVHTSHNHRHAHTHTHIHTLAFTTESRSCGQSRAVGWRFFHRNGSAAGDDGTRDRGLLRLLLPLLLLHHRLAVRVAYCSEDAVTLYTHKDQILHQVFTLFSHTFHFTLDRNY